MPRSSRWQYQVKAEPVTVPVAAEEASFGWFQQPVDQFLRPHPLQPDYRFPFPNHEQLIPSYGWFRQGEDVILPLHQTQEGGEVLGAVPIIPSYDWFHQQEDVIRPRHQTQEGLFTTAVEVELIEVDLDWYQQYPEHVYRRKPQTQTGLFTQGFDPTAIFPAYDWYKQHPEPLPHPTRPDGLLARGADDTEITPNYSWYQQHPEQVFRLPHQTDEGYVAYIADEETIEVDLDWFIQHPEIVFRAPHQTSEGLLATAQEIQLIQVDLDWYQQHPEQVFRSRPQTQTGYYVRGPEPTEFTAAYDPTIGPISAETTLLLPTLLWQAQSHAAPFILPPTITFSSSLWPFLALINPDDYPAGARFYLVVVMDTSNAAIPAQARLFNITDNAAVAGSVISTTAAHLDATAWVKSAALTLVSGAKEYRAERGGESGSGAIIHLHLARIIVQHD